jgi:hypothetical protein
MKDSAEDHQINDGESLNWPFFQSDKREVPCPGLLIGSIQDHVDLKVEDEKAEDSDPDCILIDDPRELFASGRKRQRRLPNLNIGDMVVVVSESGVLWFGKLKDCKTVTESEDASLTSSSSSSSSSSATSSSSSSTSKVSQRKMLLIHWWDHDRNDPNAKKTYLPHWNKVEGGKGKKKKKKKKRRKTADGTIQYCKSCPGRYWFPSEDWVLATSIVYWCKSGKLVNAKGVLYEVILRNLKIRVESYGHEFRL